MYKLNAASYLLINHFLQYFQETAAEAFHTTAMVVIVTSILLVRETSRLNVNSNAP